MAQGATTIVDKGGQVDFGDNVGITIPVEMLAAANPSEPNTRGIVLWDAQRTVRVPDLLDCDGRPVEFVVKLYAHRTPATADEAEKLALKQADTKARQAARKGEDQETREREIQRATAITESALAKGLQVAASTGGNMAGKVKEAFDLVAVLQNAMNPPKAIGQ